MLGEKGVQTITVVTAIGKAIMAVGIVIIREVVELAITTNPANMTKITAFIVISSSIRSRKRNGRRRLQRLLSLREMRDTS